MKDCNDNDSENEGSLMLLFSTMIEIFEQIKTPLFNEKELCFSSITNILKELENYETKDDKVTIFITESDNIIQIITLCFSIISLLLMIINPPYSDEIQYQINTLKPLINHFSKNKSIIVIFLLI